MTHQNSFKNTISLIILALSLLLVAEGLKIQGHERTFTEAFGGDNGRPFSFGLSSYKLVGISGRTGAEGKLSWVVFNFLDMNNGKNYSSKLEGTPQTFNISFPENVEVDGAWIMIENDVVTGLDFDFNNGEKMGFVGGGNGEWKHIDTTGKRITGVKGKRTQTQLTKLGFVLEP